MSGARFLRWLAAGALVAGALVASCTYSPDFRNGSLKCSADGQCPRGYTCLAQFCCLPGDPTCGGTMLPGDASVPTDGTASHFETRPPGTGGAAGTGGAGGSTVVGAGMAAYLGTWSFTAAATLDTECQGSNSSGGPVPFLTQANPTSAITITATGSNTLQAVWTEWPACPYKLSVDATGAHGTEADTDAVPWGCEYMYTTTSTNPPQINQQDWIYDSFDIVTADGKTATHDGLYFRQDTYNDKSVVYCTQTLHAPLTKQ